MKLKYQFAINDVAGEKVAIAMGEDFNYFKRFFKLNETGAYIMEKLKNDITVEELIESIKNDFDIGPEQDIEKSVTGFINKLKEADVLE